MWPAVATDRRLLCQRTHPIYDPAITISHIVSHVEFSFLLLYALLKILKPKELLQGHMQLYQK